MILGSILKTLSAKDMYLRVGIASGPLCAGVVDGRSFRAPRLSTGV